MKDLCDLVKRIRLLRDIGFDQRILYLRPQAKATLTNASTILTLIMAHVATRLCVPASTRGAFSNKRPIDCTGAASGSVRDTKVEAAVRHPSPACLIARHGTSRPPSLAAMGEAGVRPVAKEHTNRFPALNCGGTQQRCLSAQKDAR